MALLTRSDIENALRRLGELALQQDESIELLAVGGAAMVLGYDARLATHDVDAPLRYSRSQRGSSADLSSRLQRSWTGRLTG